MNKLILNKHSQTQASEENSTRVEQVAKLLALWSELGSQGMTAEAMAQQSALAENARFVVSLARQYQNQGVSQEVLVTAAHGTLITLLNQYAGSPGKLVTVMAPALRNCMVAVVQMQSDQ